MVDKNQRGTGKHPHKSTEEPYPHTRHDGGDGSQSGSSRAQSSGSDRKTSDRGSSGSSDLKQREYRDEHGNVHHHTHTYEQQHGKR